MVRTQVQLTDAQARELKQLSAERGVSMAELIRQALEAQLELSHSRAARRAVALRSIGGFRSGRTDVSADHDRYLADAFEE
jgi:hypothetical protein